MVVHLFQKPGVWGSIPGPVKFNAVLPTARLHCYVSLKGSCVAGARWREYGPLAKNYMNKFCMEISFADNFSWLFSLVILKLFNEKIFSKYNVWFWFFELEISIYKLRFSEWEDPQYLLVLAEEELIAIDLTKDDLPSFAPPYLASPHASAITCSTCAENVSEQVWNQINEVVLSSKTALKLPEVYGLIACKKFGYSKICILVELLICV